MRFLFSLNYPKCSSKHCSARETLPTSERNQSGARMRLPTKAAASKIETLLDINEIEKKSANKIITKKIFSARPPPPRSAGSKPKPNKKRIAIRSLCNEGD